MPLNSLNPGSYQVSSIHDVNGVSIEIKDTGCGITVDQQQQIFEVFHQVNSSGTLKGTGLGTCTRAKFNEIAWRFSFIKKQLR